MTATAHQAPNPLAPTAGATSQPRTSAQNGRLWGARAQDWADVQEGQFRTAYDAVFDTCGLGPGTRYCDVGCGAGMAAMLAAGRGAQVAGLDAAESLLGIARRRVPAGDFRSGDLEDLPFDPAQFDLVTGFNAFQFAANPATALAEARRITKPDGRVVMMTWGTPEGMQAAALVAALRPLLPPPPPGCGRWRFSTWPANGPTPTWLPHCAGWARRAWPSAPRSCRVRRPLTTHTPPRWNPCARRTAATALARHSGGCWRRLEREGLRTWRLSEGLWLVRGGTA